jgi:hypothetical protein
LRNDDETKTKEMMILLALGRLSDILLGWKAGVTGVWKDTGNMEAGWLSD